MVVQNQDLISIVVFSDPTFQPRALSFIHAPCEARVKDDFWDEVVGVGSTFNGSWLVMGDFNTMSGQHEKWGGRPYASSSSDGFLQMHFSLGLVDIGSSSPHFTWCNGRNGSHKIRERLDKGLANGEWLHLFPRAVIRNLPRYALDHSPILLDTFGGMNSGPKPFYFKCCWVREESSKKIVADAWNNPVSGFAAFRLVLRIKATQLALRGWNKDVFGSIPTKIKILNQQLLFIQSLPPLDQSWDAEQRIQSDLLEIMK